MLKTNKIGMKMIILKACLLVSAAADTLWAAEPQSISLSHGVTRQQSFAELPMWTVMVTGRVAEAKGLREELSRALPKFEKRGGGEKTRATVAVMDNFFEWIEEDVRRGQTHRLDRETSELIDIGRAEIARLMRVTKGEERDASGPRYVMSPVENSHMQTIATRRWPDGHTDRGPIFFTGFGHFGMIQRDLTKMPPLGNNILQMEIGPAAVLPSENKVNLHALDNFFEVAQRAERENVLVCLLLSPHYFPEWAFAKWPDLKDDSGFIKFCMHDPRARMVLEKYLRVVVPRLRNVRALHSLCLTNEPENMDYDKCQRLREEWPKWLAKRFGTVGKMNAKWRTDYAALDKVPLPKNWEAAKPSPESVEFARFDQRMHAEFHEWMAGIVRSMAPEIPLHVKIMCQNWQWFTASLVSVNVEDFSALSDLNGNDATYWAFFDPNPKWPWGESVSEWPLCEIAYDYQRSAAEKPIFNSENHIIRDRQKEYVSGCHVYTALWQQALHGQAMTTLWSWERAFDDGKSDFNGLILERPECLNAWAHCALDLNRLADVLAPIQNQEAPILLLNSLSSRMWRDGVDQSYECYRALNALGRQIGVVSERMLENYAKTGNRERPLAAARVIVMPTPGHLPDATREALLKLMKEGMAVVSYASLPERDDAGNLRDGTAFTFVGRTDSATLLKTFAKMSASWNLPDVPRVRALDADHGVEGVESRGVRMDGNSFLSVVNHGAHPVKVRLETDAVDLISGAHVGQICELESQKPMLLEYAYKADAAEQTPLAEAYP